MPWDNQVGQLAWEKLLKFAALHQADQSKPLNKKRAWQIEKLEVAHHTRKANVLQASVDSVHLYPNLFVGLLRERKSNMLKFSIGALGDLDRTTLWGPG